MSDLSSYSFNFSFKNKLLRLIWNICSVFLFKATPSTIGIFKYWRIFILKCFGADLSYNSLIYSSAKIWAPWNLQMGEYSTIGPNVTVYNQAKITIGNHTVISQNAHLCASSHDYTKSNFPLILKPITIGNRVWVAADAFVGPNVIIEDNVVIAARAVVVSRVEKSTIVGGNPAKIIKNK